MAVPLNEPYMRPNIDISWSLHGDVKEYSERTGQSIEEAYVNILQRGLDTTTERSRQFSIGEPEDVIFSPIHDNLGVGKVALFSDFGEDLYVNGDPTVIRSSETNISTDRAEEILADLHHRLLADDGNYSIHQKNAAWYGAGGLDKFFFWLDNLDDLYRVSPDEYAIEKHRTASAAFISSAAFPAEHVLVYAKPNSSGTIEKFGIEILLDGYPAIGREIVDFADTVGMELSHAHTWATEYEIAEEFERVDIGEEGPIQLVRKLTREEDENEVIEGIVCENPFFEDDAAERTFSDPNVQSVAKGVRYLPGRMIHTVDEDMRHQLFTTRFRFVDLEEITEAPFSLVNARFKANW